MASVSSLPTPSASDDRSSAPLVHLRRDLASLLRGLRLTHAQRHQLVAAAERGRATEPERRAGLLAAIRDVEVRRATRMLRP